MIRALLTTTTVLLTTLAAACGGGTDTATTASGRDLVKVGVVPVVDVAPLYLGIEQGFFADENIEIETVNGQGGPELIAGVMSGNLHVGISASTPLVQARANNLAVTAVAPVSATAGQEGPKSALVVPKRSDIRDVTDLNGATVAVNGLKSINELLVRADVDKQGGDSSSLKFVELPFPDMAAALDAGRVDAIATTEPFLSDITATIGRTLTEYPANVKGPDTPMTYWFTSAQQYQDNSEVFQRFVKAWDASVTYAKENPERVRQILTTYTELTPDQIGAMNLPEFKTELGKASFRQDAKLMVRYGFIENAPDLAGLVP